MTAGGSVSPKRARALLGKPGCGLVKGCSMQVLSAVLSVESGNLIEPDPPSCLQLPRLLRTGASSRFAVRGVYRSLAGSNCLRAPTIQQGRGQPSSPMSHHPALLGATIAILRCGVFVYFLVQPAVVWQLLAGGGGHFAASQLSGVGQVRAACRSR